MRLIPAIDIKNGHCTSSGTFPYYNTMMYSNSPKKVAKLWEKQGADCLHVIDVDGAFTGNHVNEDVIQSLIEHVSIPVEVGGGIRSIQAIEHMLNLGAKRVIIGTKAAENPAFIKDAIQLFGADRIVVSIDAKNGMVAVEGWEKLSNYNAIVLMKKMKDLGIKTIHYSDITIQGQDVGLNIEQIKEVVQVSHMNVIIKNGISSMKDIEVIQQAGAYGAIIDHVLYEERISLKEAIEFVKARKDCNNTMMLQ